MCVCVGGFFGAIFAVGVLWGCCRGLYDGDERAVGYGKMGWGGIGSAGLSVGPIGCRM